MKTFVKCLLILFILVIACLFISSCNKEVAPNPVATQPTVEIPVVSNEAPSLATAVKQAIVAQSKVFAQVPTIAVQLPKVSTSINTPIIILNKPAPIVEAKKISKMQRIGHSGIFYSDDVDVSKITKVYVAGIETKRYSLTSNMNIDIWDYNTLSFITVQW